VRTRVSCVCTAGPGVCSAADAPVDVGCLFPPSLLPPCLQVDQNDTRTQLHYAIMLRDKMAPQKVRAIVCGVAGGGREWGLMFVMPCCRRTTRQKRH
jgi:hypothetical protein